VVRRSLILLLVGGVVELVLVGAAAFFLGDKHAAEAMSVKRASPNELAEAMKQDHFFSSYRESTLLVRGTVVSADHADGGGMVGLQTGSTYSLTCDLGHQPMSAHLVDAVTVLAEGSSAERQSSGVLLRGCTIP
jgi:hypothetical protein